MKGSLDLIESRERELAEQARWRAHLAPKAPACCNQHCKQGDECPLRARQPSRRSVVTAVRHTLLIYAVLALIVYFNLP